MHTVFALLCFVVVIHWLIFPYPSGLLHWHCGNLTIAPVPAKQPWWIWINTSCEFILNDYITTTKQSTMKLCAYFLGYTVYVLVKWITFGSDNGLLPVQCWLIANWILMNMVQWNLNQMQNFSFMKMYLKCRLWNDSTTIMVPVMVAMPYS